MGVTGLWSLIEDAGTRINIETLNHKILAIDLSIWINQSIKGFRDRDGRSIENAHLLGLFYRLCKLLFYRIKPIVVFDGECPQLKLKTVQKRSERNKKNLSKSKNLSINVLENFISSQLMLSDVDRQKAMTLIKEKAKNRQFLSEFYLPHFNPRQDEIYSKFIESKQGSSMHSRESNDEDGASDSESYTVDETYHHPNLQNIHDIDINSQQFKSLPAVTRYEILVELRDSYKQRKNFDSSLLPQESNDFSKFQMAKLLKKRNLQEEIERLIQELNGYYDDEKLELLKKSQDHFDIEQLSLGKISSIQTGRSASDENTHFLLLKTLDKAIEEFTGEQDDDELEGDDIYSIKSEIKEEQSTQIYDVPNTLPGEKNIETLDERLEFFENKNSANNLFDSKLLSQNLNQNYQKFSNEKTPKIVLSENESSSSSSTDSDFDEVPMIESDPASKDLLFDENVPYETSFNLEIKIDQSSISSERLNEMIDEVISDGKSTNTSINVLQSSSEFDFKVIQNTEIEEIAPVHSDSKALVLEKDTKSLINEIKNPEILDKTQCESHPLNKVTDQQSKDDSNQTETIILEKIKEISKESNKLQRQAATVNHKIISDCQELLRLFGVPWIVAPAEAEAQCAILEELGICEGVITDDSDIFLFGGKNVYKNFFVNTKYILNFKIEDLKKFYGLDRTKFICLAMLCGSDYTLGVDGVGPVTALEILSQFPGEGLQCLIQFARWHHRCKSSANPRPDNSQRAKFLKLCLPKSFPSRIIYEAYLNANVDDSRSPFSWSTPQLSEIRQFALNRFGWSEARTDAFLLPVLKNLNSTQRKYHFLFIPMDSYGHINSCIGIAQKLAQNGHQISFALEKAWTNYLINYRFNEVIYEALDRPKNLGPNDYWAQSIAKIQDNLHEDSLSKAKHFSVEEFKDFIFDALSFDEQLAVIIKNLKPDLILVDNYVTIPAVYKSNCKWVFMTSASPLSALSHPDLPPSSSGYPTDGNRDAWKVFNETNENRIGPVVSKFNCELKKRGLPDLPQSSLFHPSPYLNIYAYPKELDYLDIRPLPPKWKRFDHFIRIKDMNFKPINLPEKFKNFQGHKIYVSMGSMGCAHFKLMLRLVDIFSKSKHLYMMVLGPNRLDLPENIYGERMLPQLQMLKWCDLFITHGGNNSVVESLYYGKPMIVNPLFYDQYDNAQRITEKGYGARINAYTCEPDQLLTMIEMILDNPTIKTNCKKISENLQKTDNYQAISNALLEVVELN
ncbi:XP-G DNA excision repair-like protein [Sarcoptes scabiei]|uniref:XP-G DNA excision repair-like protein n=1 Tax=Sarcoptes scabiei TaxID=52283 RepID=A0A132A1C5_SARSC|nr:XP-G DNA excision repair-like protein [Sarcoptes scabiei]